MCWYGKKSTFISTVTMSTARTVPSVHAARAPASRLAATEALAGDTGPPMRPGRRLDTRRPTA